MPDGPASHVLSGRSWDFSSLAYPESIAPPFKCKPILRLCGFGLQKEIPPYAWRSGSPILWVMMIPEWAIEMVLIVIWLLMHRWHKRACLATPSYLSAFPVAVRPPATASQAWRRWWIGILRRNRE